MTNRAHTLARLSTVAMISVLMLCALAIALPTGVLLAHDGVTGIVKERHDAMKSMGRSLKALKTTLDAGRAPDRAELQAISKQLAKPAGARLLALFPKDGPRHKSEALPLIWTEWESFSRSAMDMEARAVSLAAARADISVLRSQLRAIAGICKDCHDRFRKR
jgi:cytochrome c556